MKKAFSFAFAVLSVAACHIGETSFEEVTIPLTEASAVKTCDAKFVTVDLDLLTPCGDAERGKGHCYDPAKVGILDAELMPCADASKACVPDKFLLANGEKAKACRFLGGDKPGACTSLLVGQINANRAVLKQDACDADERCGPCINPLDQTNSGLCEPAGAHETACIGGTSAAETEECCHGVGVCMDASGVPAEQRDMLSSEVCSEGKLCAPAALANGKPKKCSSVLGFSGVCLDVCFSTMLKGAGNVFGRDDCNPTEVCVPCIFGKGQGMPGCE